MIDNFWIDAADDFTIHLEGNSYSNLIKNPKNFFKHNLAKLSLKGFDKDTYTGNCA